MKNCTGLEKCYWILNFHRSYSWLWTLLQDSYLALERAFLELGKFYSSKGPQAPLPEDIKNRVLEDLNKADESI